ncbi:MAG: hypothetical protein LCH91_27430 [Bacteroidetes bacterium]|nr:hypothetical protein [Bacteroidota bacterium]
MKKIIKITDLEKASYSMTEVLEILEFKNHRKLSPSVRRFPPVGWVYFQKYRTFGSSNLSKRMSLQSFVETFYPSALREAQSLGLADNVLTTYEIALIYHYSDLGFESVNEALRNNTSNPQLRQYAQFLVECLEKTPDYQDVVFRGEALTQTQKQRYINAYEHSIPIQIPTFFSTSKSELIGNQFSKRNTLLTIFSKTGKEIERFAKFGIHSGQNEKEVLFVPSCSFEVLEVSISSSITLITLGFPL